MVNYQNGKVYRLVCNVTGLQYVGSTTEPLSKRKAGHIGQFKYWMKGGSHCHFYTSFKVIQGGNVDIVLLENAPCNNKEELLRAERKWIEQLDCVNRTIPTRSYTEWVKDNADKVRENSKQYRMDNTESIREYQRTYKDANRQHINEYKKRLFDCPCGSTYRKNEKARHERTTKHTTWLNATQSS